ncbi:hypothetical protein [Dapis sp. BLCC M172]|uniref:hypothetical protein n=1 Tax=Dapis sp. BLCC M172 TaxID=2975281 RepID=UPI003CF27FC5
MLNLTIATYASGRTSNLESKTTESLLPLPENIRLLFLYPEFLLVRKNLLVNQESKN